MSALTDFAILLGKIQSAAALMDQTSTLASAVGQEIAAVIAASLPSGQTMTQPTPTGITYYVSAAGNDANDGKTQATAWKTLAKVNSQTFAHGDGVLFRGGDVFPGSLTAGATIFGSYGTGKAVISSADQHGIHCLNPSGVGIYNLIVLGYGGATNKGIFIENDGTAGQLPGPTIKGCLATGYGSDGILVFGHPGAGFTAPYVGYCEVFGCTGADLGALTSGIGIWAGGVSNASPCFPDPIVEYCYVHDNPGCAGPNWSGSGIFIQGSLRGFIQHNESARNGANCQASNGSGPVGIWTADSDSLTIQFNNSHDNSSLTADGGGFDLDGGVINATVQYNLATGNRNYGLSCYAYEGAWGNNVIRFNIFVNNIGSQISYGGTGGASHLGKLYIANNVLIGDERYVDQSWHSVITCPDWLPQQFDQVVVADNVIWARGGAYSMIIDASTATTTFVGNSYPPSPDGNAYVKWAGAFSTVPQWNLDPKALLGDPGFVDITQIPAGLALSAASPLHGAGINVAATYALSPATQGYFGNPISPVDIGAG